MLRTRKINLTRIRKIKPARSFKYKGGNPSVSKEQKKIYL